MSKKGLLDKQRVPSSAPSPSSASSDLLVRNDNPFIAPETKKGTKNPFLSPKVDDVSQEVEVGSSSAFSVPEQENFSPQITPPSIVNQPTKPIEESIKTEVASASSMVPPSASDRKKKR